MYKVEKLRLEKIPDVKNGTYILMFFKIDDETVFPYLAKGNETFTKLKGSLSNTMRKFGLKY